MAELIAAPGQWAPFVDLTSNELSTAIGDKRIISIKSYEKDGQRLYSGILVKDKIASLGWTANMSANELRQTVSDAGGRLIALDAFYDAAAGALRCAASWIANTDGRFWNFDPAMDAVRLSRLLQSDGIKLTCIRVVHAQSDLGFAAIWIADDGQTWKCEPAIDLPTLGLRLDDNVGQLVSFDVYPPGFGLDGKVAAVWWKNDGGNVWFWNVGLDGPATKEAFPKFCSYGLELVPAGPGTFGSIMCQFPKPIDPNAVSIFEFGGSGTAALRDDLAQDLDWTFTEKNLSSSQVTYRQATMLYTMEGGWCSGVNNFTGPPSQADMLGLPLMMPSPYSGNTRRIEGYTNNPKRGIFCLSASDAAGKHQEMLVQIPLTNTGTPPLLPIKWPVFAGLIGPIEGVRLANGKVWVTVLGQVCNGTTLPLTVTHVALRMRSGDRVLHESYLTDKLRVDTVSSGGPLLGADGKPTSIEGPVVNANYPFPKFLDGFDVTNDFSGGKLKVSVNVKLAGNLECFGDTQEVEVRFAPSTLMPSLPFGTPVWSDASIKLYWHWGNGVGATYFHAHSYPEHRYTYDVSVQNQDGRSLKAGGDPQKNEDYYSWGQAIHAMADGTVVFVDDTHADNAGDTGAPPGLPGPTGTNLVVLESQLRVDGVLTRVRQLYAHCQQGSAVDQNGNRIAVGTSVRAGDQIGRLGNAGASSGPHLHVAISTQDAEGFLRPLPLGFARMKTKDDRVVSGVPADGEFYGP